MLKKLAFQERTGGGKVRIDEHDVAELSDDCDASKGKLRHR